MFDLYTTKSGTLKEKLLYSFGTNGGPNDGASPGSGVIQTSINNVWSDTIYGTTGGGGVYSAGAIFAISLKTGQEKLLHSLDGVNDGYLITAGLTQDSKGNLYGVAQAAGNTNACNNQGCGTLFRITPKGDFKVLHAFLGGPTDGQTPQGTLLNDGHDNLFGTTQQGGANGGGTIFELTSSGKYKVLYTKFASGAWPVAQLTIDPSGNLYGVSQGGGQYLEGMAFELTPAGKFTDIHDFGITSPCCDAYNPTGSLSYDDSNGPALYGAEPGGTYSCVTEGGCGVIFKLTPP